MKPFIWILFLLVCALIFGGMVSKQSTDVVACVEDQELSPAEIRGGKECIGDSCKIPKSQRPDNLEVY